MTSNFKLTLLSSVAAAAVTVMTAGTANATFGMLPHCVGTVKCGMGGAGSSRGIAAVDATVNPAVGVQMGNQYQVNLGLFKSNVDGKTMVTRSGVGNRLEGPLQESNGTFPNGSLGVNYVIDDTTTFNLSIVPGGGGASKWNTARTANFGITTNDQEITYEMVYLQPSVAFKVSDTASYGVGAILSRSTMKTDSIYGNFTATSNPNSKSTFWGVGFQAGGVWNLADLNKGKFAVNLRSPVWHQDTGNVYNNTVFISPIDTPMQLTAGIDFEAADNLTVAMDYKFVNWSGTETIGQPAYTLNVSPNSGFGWDNQHIVMFGLEYAIDDATNVRAGYSHGNSPIAADNVFANFLFPAIIEDHFTVGADTDIGGGMNVGFSAYVTPEASVTDNGTGTGYSGMGAGTALRHQQYGFQLSFTNEF
ncbi:MAG TPA: outer membrane protein transport protein [Magnetovibrio sp.]